MSKTRIILTQLWDREINAFNHKLKRSFLHCVSYVCCWSIESKEAIDNKHKAGWCQATTPKLLPSTHCINANIFFLCEQHNWVCEVVVGEWNRNSGYSNCPIKSCIVRSSGEVFHSKCFSVFFYLPLMKSTKCLGKLSQNKTQSCNRCQCDSRCPIPTRTLKSFSLCFSFKKETHSL